jgi:hypothetical protein
MKPLKHSNIDFEGKLKAGDPIVFQHYKSDKLHKGDITAIEIVLMQIESVKEGEETFKPTHFLFDLPTWRIRSVIDPNTSLAHNYKGYDFNRIEMDEGEITEETYKVLKEIQKERTKKELE